MQEKQYYVYIMANESRTLYTGVTSDLARRVGEHKSKRHPGFTKKYSISKLVFFEAFADVHDAIGTEKKIKGWLRRKKIALIEESNPGWADLAADWI
jgi:putative endonuclease